MWWIYLQVQNGNKLSRRLTQWKDAIQAQQLNHGVSTDYGSNGMGNYQNQRF